MLQIVLGIIAIGLTLYFWERFPSFKWVVAVIIAIPVLAVISLSVNQHIKSVEKEKEQIQFVKKQELAAQEEEIKSSKQSYENLSHIVESIKIRIKESNYANDEEKQQDINHLKQFEIWMNEAKAKAQKGN